MSANKKHIEVSSKTQQGKENENQTADRSECNGQLFTWWVAGIHVNHLDISEDLNDLRLRQGVGAQEDRAESRKKHATSCAQHVPLNICPSSRWEGYIWSIQFALRLQVALNCVWWGGGDSVCGAFFVSLFYFKLIIINVCAFRRLGTKLTWAGEPLQTSYQACLV